MESIIIALLYIVTFFLGASIGSFSLVVVRRTHNKENGSWAKGKSICESCKKELSWWELIPFVSFIALGGKCSKCRTRIDPSHFFCETFTGIVYVFLSFLFLNGKIQAIDFVIFLIVHSVMIALSFEDFLYREIHTLPVYALSVVALIYETLKTKMYYMIAVVIVLFILSAILGRRDNCFAFGFGDVDFALLILALTFSGIAIVDVLVYGSVVGIIMALTILRKKNGGIPFVPCMYVGYVLHACGISVTECIYGLMNKLLSL